MALFIYALVTVAREWSGPLQELPEIHLEPRFLPLYALFSLSRGVIAYAVSFLFTMVYGYTMARVTGAERVLLPVLDILQSIPVLGFLPGFVLGLVHIFPQRNFGLEIASVLMIFTGQAWNMTFSFYSSLKSVPPDLVAVARLSLGWVTTPGGRVEMAGDGRTFLAAEVNRRKQILNTTLRGIFIFDLVVQMLKQSPNQEVEESVVLTQLVLTFPHEPPQRILRTIVA